MNNFRFVLAISVALLAPVVALADSYEYSETRRSVTDPSGRTTTTESVIERTSNEIPMISVTRGVYVQTLGARRIQLENAIAEGLASGRLSNAQAQILRAQLDEVSRIEAAGGEEFGVLVPLALTLDRVGNTVHELVPTAIFDPIVRNGRFVLSDGRIVVLDDIMVRRAELESRISGEFAQGKLSAKEVALLRSDLSKIAQVEQQMRAGGRKLTYKDSRLLYRMFDKVGAKIDRFV